MSEEIKFEWKVISRVALELVHPLFTVEISKGGTKNNAVYAIWFESTELKTALFNSYGFISNFPTITSQKKAKKIAEHIITEAMKLEKQKLNVVEMNEKYFQIKTGQTFLNL